MFLTTVEIGILACLASNDVMRWWWLANLIAKLMSVSMIVAQDNFSIQLWVEVWYKSVYEKQDKAFNKCQDACPCYRSCPNGCSSCAHETCSCADAENNPDFLACSIEANENYFACINQCPVNDMLCISACGRSYEHSLERCPCQELCPGKKQLLYKL